MLQTLRNAWKIEELRKKILFTLVIILLYRLGNAIPVPDVNIALLNAYFAQQQSTILGLLDVMSGGAFSNATIFALSIQPYINASIIIQLLCIAIPSLQRLSKEGGEEGRKKIASITRYATVAIGLIQGFAYYMLIMNNNMLNADAQGIWSAIVIILTFTSGSALIMWLGEQITEFGIGNGISMILFASIISRLPTSLITTVRNITAGNLQWWLALLMLIGAIAMIVLIVYVNDAERRIPVQYAKRVVGRKMYGGQSTHLPMKVNMSGVMPIIFASTLCSLPGLIFRFINLDAASHPALYAFFSVFNYNSVLYLIVYVLLIVAFNYFYVAIQYNPVDIANQLRKNNGTIPGIRPGKPTSDFITKTLSKITLIGAIFLAIVAGFPIILGNITGTSIQLGGTTLLIVVGVALETGRSLEGYMTARYHKGFLE